MANEINKTTLNTMATRPILHIRALGPQWETQDPFLFCVHHEDHYPPGNEKMGPATSLAGRSLGQDFDPRQAWRMYHGQEVPGFPGHPHRGFETLTVVRSGIVDHSDSAGGEGRYGNGDLQWMTAGKGLLHAEMFPLLHTDQDNPLELFQIWLNLPAKYKLVAPDYKMFWAEDIPKVQPQTGVSLEVLVGDLAGHSAPTPPQYSWANDAANDVGVYNIYLAAGASFLLPPTAAGVNRSLYFYRGEALVVSTQPIAPYHAADLVSTAEVLLENKGEQTAKILVLQGRPIQETVVQHGPFVMNSREEIQQAFRDYQQGDFGQWPYATYEKVHERSKGRFAAYPDGRVEKKN